ncbi:MAG: HAMP domain-containing histidine kinase, partial [Eubacterium sp.]|nr:HAMP domain-containing histidine kinase [Eubacterium sp.]
MIKRYKDLCIASIISLIAAAAGFYLIYRINEKGAFVFLAVSLLILMMFLFITVKRINTIKNLNRYLNAISNGDYNLDIKDNSEGELSIIKNNLYKIIVTLRSQQELLLKDKNYLAESLADISHQLKTPITSITMMSDLLKNEEDEEKRKEFLEVIENQLSRMNWLIVTLLKLSKIDAGATEFKNSTVSLKSILEKSAQPFLLNAEINNIDLSVECADHIKVFVDSNWYIEAVSNIIKNCIEHTENGGYVRIYAEETAVFTKIYIKDNGSGIAKEDLPHVFERFYQGKNHNESSVGIGLALSKAILNKQNSMVEVRS